MNNKEELNRYISELSKHKSIKLFQKNKVYDVARDINYERLYEIDSEEENAINKER